MNRVAREWMDVSTGGRLATLNESTRVEREVQRDERRREEERRGRMEKEREREAMRAHQAPRGTH